MPLPFHWILSLLATQGSAVPHASLPPRLVVLLAVDQLIPEQLQRLAPWLEGGLGRFLREGTFYWRATVDYANTETAPGHATLATGRHPCDHGIVANVFFDRSSGKNVYAVADPEAHPVTSRGLDEKSPGASARNLRASTLGDYLRDANGASRTVAVAGKDRSAILLGGKHADLALWWDERAGGFATSSAYGERLPGCGASWNATWLERARGWTWEPEFTGDMTPAGTAPDDRPGESTRLGRAFPHQLPADERTLPLAVLFSPLVDLFTLEVAGAALDELELGRDDATDLLAISLSACDAVGHAHGPDSVEVTDVLLRADRELGRLFAHLDERVGRERWIACLSADHGVLDLPEALAERGVGARRVKGEEVAAMREQVEEALSSLHPAEVDLELRYSELGFSFDEEAARKASLEPRDVRATIAEAAEEAGWVAGAYTLEEILASNAGGPVDPWLQLYARCQCPDRGPDVVLRPHPWLLVDAASGTSHGSPYPYDRRVPLAFLGPPFRAQQRFDAASPTDAVPTLLQVLGLPLPEGLDGHALASE